MRSMYSAGTGTFSSFTMNSALRWLISGQMPAITGIRNVLDALQEIARAARWSNTGCVTAYSAPACTFHSKRRISSSRFERAGIGADPDQQRGLRTHGIAADVEAVIQVVDDVDEPDGVHVEDGRGGRVGAHARRDRR